MEDDAIKRLRASKEKCLAEDKAAGQEDGQIWAENAAEDDELKGVAEITETTLDHVSNPKEILAALMRAVDPHDELTFADAIENLFGDQVDAEKLSKEYLLGFIKGAREFYLSAEKDL